MAGLFAQSPRIDTEACNLLKRPILLAELKETLKSYRDSAPGLDGIPYSYYREYGDILLPLLLESWNFSVNTGFLPISHKRSCITPVPKEGKDLPISLSSCHLKIIMKSLANRLKTVLPDLPFEHQGACIPGWDINFNNRLLRYAKS